MARTVRDLAKLLDVQSGHDPRVPLSLTGGDDLPFAAAEQAASARGVRIGWLGDLQGHLAFEPGILTLCERALRRLEGEGARIEPASLGFSAEALWRAWLTWRQALIAPLLDHAIKRGGTPDAIKPEAQWEHAEGCALSALDLMRASQVRTAFHAQLLRLFERYDLLALPSAQVWPFPIGERWPQRIGAREMDTYHRWMEVTLYATFGGLPALSAPAGFDPSTDRLPMGLQLIGPPRGEAKLLRVAFAYEATIGELLARRPPGL
jgi:amidase